MARVDWTDKPCPCCEADLELHVEKIAPPPGTVTTTAKVVRILMCPKCAYTREDEPALLADPF